MKNLRQATGDHGILERVKRSAAASVEFKPDSSLTLRATLQLARQRVPLPHVLRTPSQRAPRLLGGLPGRLPR